MVPPDAARSYPSPHFSKIRARGRFGAPVSGGTRSVRPMARAHPLRAQPMAGRQAQPAGPRPRPRRRAVPDRRAHGVRAVRRLRPRHAARGAQPRLPGRARTARAIPLRRESDRLPRPPVDVGVVDDALGRSGGVRAYFRRRCRAHGRRDGRRVPRRRRARRAVRVGRARPTPVCRRSPTTSSPDACAVTPTRSWASRRSTR